MKRILQTLTAALVAVGLTIALPVSANAGPGVCGGGSCDATQAATNNTYMTGLVHWCFWDGTADISSEAYPHEAVAITNHDDTSHNFELQIRREEPTNALLYQGPTLLIGPSQTKRWENVNMLYYADSAKIYLYIEGLWGSHPVWRISGYHPNGPEPTWEATINTTYDRGTFDC